QVQTYLDWNTQVCNLQEVVEVPGGNPLDCPSLNANFGDSCDDGNPNTINDVVMTDCSCAGTPVITGCDNVTDGGLISGNETLCPGEDAGLIYSDVEPSGGTGDIEYIWLSSTTGCPTSLSQVVPHAQSATFDPGELTVTTYYRRCSRRSSCPSDDAWLAGESNCVVKTVEDNGNCGSTGCPPAGTTCDDNDANTIDDVEDGNCNCAGIPINTGGCTNTTNVALNGIASQSSTITAAGITGSAAKAIDGNTNGVFFTGNSSTSSVSATHNTTQPYWEVELDATYLIEQINVYNRTDGSDQSNDVYVLVSNTPFTATDLAGARAEADFEEFIPGLVGTPSTVSPSIEGKYVRIQMQGSGYLVLAEVEVMGCSNSTSNFAIPNMLFFNAEKDGFKAELSWMMMRDVAVDFYEVEVSTDGTNFRLLGDTNADKVDAPREYNITDLNPVYGENFYRLKVNNLDGTSFYSGVRRLTYNIDFDQVILYPNPTDKIINVTLRDFAGKSGTIEIYNSLGQKMAGREYLSFPTIPATFNVENFVGGIYTISIKIENNKRFTKKFVVTKL
ncbi:MAG: discoidin domain-containing protein, partial [Saprospiraceae bacterium]